MRSRSRIPTEAATGRLSGQSGEVEGPLNTDLQHVWVAAFAAMTEDRWCLVVDAALAVAIY
jgi:hypothetical protein